MNKMNIFVVSLMVVFFTLIFSTCNLTGINDLEGNNNLNSIAAPGNFRVEEGLWLVWDSDEKAERNKIYVKRPGEDFEEITWDNGGSDMIFLPNNYTTIKSLGLVEGENIIKVVSFGGDRWNNEKWTTEYDYSAEATTTITVDNIIEEQVASPDADFSIRNNQIEFFGNVTLYFKHPGQEEFMLIEGFYWHGLFSGELPDLRLGESMLKAIRLGTWAKLEGTTLTVFTNSEPTFIPIKITGFETRHLSAPTNLRVTGSGTSATLHWNVETDIWASYVTVKHPGEDDFGHSVQAFYNSVPLNRLNLTLGDNEIKVMNPDGRTVIEGTTLVKYEPGYIIYTLTVHHEQQISTPKNFRIGTMIWGGSVIPSLTWDRDPITNGNNSTSTIENNYTSIEAKNPGQEEFRRAPMGGTISEISLQDSEALRSWIHYGENIVRVRIATSNVSVIDDVVTRYTPSDWGYVTLVKDANNNITLHR